jgi:uncharacterized protein (TIGR03435 family)
MIGGFGVCVLLAAQPRFDVASIKAGGEYDPHAYNRKHGGPGTSDPDRITFSQMSLNFLILMAYGLQNRAQIAGPAWMGESDRFFTVTATMPPDTTPEQLQLMLQDRLAERLHLAVHHETKNLPATVAPGWTKVPQMDSRYRYLSGQSCRRQL